jgi:heme A synthase
VVRTAGPIVLGFVLAQVAFGVLNILLGIPVWLSALHLGNAAAILGLMLILTLRLAFAPVAIAGALPAGAR